MTREETLKTIYEVIDDFVPIGTIQCFAMYNLPKHGIWMECDGSALSKVTYPELYSKIGDTFLGDNRIGENADIFFIPNLQGQFIRGYDPECILDSKRNFGSFQKHAIQGHSHVFTMEGDETTTNGSHTHTHHADCETVNGFAGGTSVHYIYNGFYDSNKTKRDTTSNGSHSHKLPKMSVGAVQNGGHRSVNVATETRPSNIALLFCIRVK